MFQIAMPQAWNAGMSVRDQKIFNSIYGEARFNEEIYVKMMKLVLTAKAPGTIASYSAAISRWQQYARSRGCRTFPPDRQDFALYLTNLSEQGVSYSSIELMIFSALS